MTNSQSPSGPEIWEELAHELGAAPASAPFNWSIPGNWRAAKPQAYRFIFGQSTLPDINRPGNIQMTLGHIVEKVSGGTHSLDNLMPQLNDVNVKLAGIYNRKSFSLPVPGGGNLPIAEINGKPIDGSLREAFLRSPNDPNAFSTDEQRAISYCVLQSVNTPEFENRLAELMDKVPNAPELVEHEPSLASEEQTTEHQPGEETAYHEPAPASEETAYHEPAPASESASSSYQPSYTSEEASYHDPSYPSESTMYDEPSLTSEEDSAGSTDEGDHSGSGGSDTEEPDTEEPDYEEPDYEETSYEEPSYEETSSEFNPIEEDHSGSDEEDL